MLTKPFPPYQVVYFVNSGSEANDLALLMARVHTSRFDTVTLRNSYHGASPYTAALSGNSKSKYMLANGFGIHHVSTVGRVVHIIRQIKCNTISGNCNDPSVLWKFSSFYIK